MLRTAQDEDGTAPQGSVREPSRLLTWGKPVAGLGDASWMEIKTPRVFPIKEVAMVYCFDNMYVVRGLGTYVTQEQVVSPGNSGRMEFITLAS
jgi:hypothetical protein